MVQDRPPCDGHDCYEFAVSLSFLIRSTPSLLHSFSKHQGAQNTELKAVVSNIMPGGQNRPDKVSNLAHLTALENVMRRGMDI